MNSQLVAAENLSESLSKQMASLSIKSPSGEQRTVKELFETIGIPYQPSSGINTPSSKKLSLSNSATSKEQSKKNQGSAFKGCEPEMSRRRRDSLDQVLLSCNLGIHWFKLLNFAVWHWLRPCFFSLHLLLDEMPMTYKQNHLLCVLTL